VVVTRSFNLGVKKSIFEMSNSARYSILNAMRELLYLCYTRENSFLISFVYPTTGRVGLPCHTLGVPLWPDLVISRFVSHRHAFEYVGDVIEECL